MIFGWWRAYLRVFLPWRWLRWPARGKRAGSRKITLRAVLESFVAAALILFLLQSCGTYLSYQYPATAYRPLPDLPDPTTTRMMVAQQDWTPQELYEIVHHQVPFLRHDPNCVGGIDVSSAHAGTLCLP